MPRLICWSLLACACVTMSACSKSEPLGGVDPGATGAATTANGAAADGAAPAEAAPAVSLQSLAEQVQAQQAERDRVAKEQAEKETAELEALAAAAPPGPRPSVLMNAMTAPLEAMLQNSMQSLMAGGGPLQGILPSRNEAKNDKPADEAKPAE